MNSCIQLRETTNVTGGVVPSGSDVAPDVEAAVELDEPFEAVESEMEMMRRVWRKSEPWRDTGVTAEEAHAHSNVAWVPGSSNNPFTWPPVGPPSSDDP